MDVEKVYKDYNWKPSDGDYYLSPHDDDLKRKKVAEEKRREKLRRKRIRFSVFVLFPALLTLILIAVLFLKIKI